jgi:hypothetical protein
MILTTVTNVSLDGVTQGHRRIAAGNRREAGAPDVDGSEGFERFGWGPPLLDDEASAFISQAFQRADAFLFGRRTYEIFAGSWGAGHGSGKPRRRGVEYAGQVRRLDHAHRPTMGRSPPPARTQESIQTYRTTGRPQYETATT